MMQEIAASGAGASGASAVHFYLFSPAPIIRHGSEKMKQEFLPKLARGEILMAFGVTEPTAGVDTSRIRTKAEKVDGGWVVNGQKVWISNAQNAHKILLLARTSARNEDKPLDGRRSSSPTWTASGSPSASGLLRLDHPVRLYRFCSETKKARSPSSRQPNRLTQ